jgi:hypothetical protein
MVEATDVDGDKLVGVEEFLLHEIRWTPAHDVPS